MNSLKKSIAGALLAAASFLSLFAEPAVATDFTTNVPGTNIQLPDTYPEAGGIAIVLVGNNGNIYYQFSNPSSMFRGRNFNGSPRAFRGNPFQAAPTATLDCGVTNCNMYFGGGIQNLYIRFTAYDGDTQPGGFDENKINLQLNGFDVGSWSGLPTQATNTAGTVAIRNGVGFGNNTFDTGWFASQNPALLNNIYNSESLTSTILDATPNDNYWDFRRGNDADETIVPTRVAPGSAIEKTSTTTQFLAVGEVIPYSYTVSNIGNVRIDDVSVSDDKVATVTCDPDTLPRPGTVATQTVCTGNYTVLQEDVDRGFITNVAQATGTPEAGVLGAVTDDLTIPGPAHIKQIDVTKSASPATFGAANTTVDFPITVTNNGNVTLTNVVVTDALDPSYSCTIATLPPVAASPNNIDTSCNFIYTVKQSDVDAGTLSNTVNVTSKAPDNSDVISNFQLDITGPAAAPALTLVKNALTADYDAVNDTLAYQYVITNSGNVTLSGPFTVDDDKIAAVSCPAFPATLGPNGSITCSANYTVTQDDLDAGSVVNNATASDANGNDSAQVQATVNAVQTNGLSLVKRLSSSSPTSFSSTTDVLAYEYVVTNDGNISITTDISVADDKVDILGSVTCPATSTLPDAKLLPGASVTCTANYNVTQDDIDNGGVTNAASATDGTSTTPESMVFVPSVRTPSMAMTKVADLPAGFVFQTGAVVPYDYEVTNNGNTTITDPIEVTDSLIGTFVCGTLPAGGLLPTQSVTCTRNYTVIPDDLKLGSVTNLATASDGTTTSPQVSATVPDGANPALSIDKSIIARADAGGNAIAQASAVDDVITYQYVVTNASPDPNGGTFGGDVLVKDNKISGDIVCLDSSVDTSGFIPTETVTCTAQYAVTQDDLDAGEVTNEAIASSLYADTSPTPRNIQSPPKSVTEPLLEDAGIEITKTPSPATFGAAGTTVDFTLSVQNTGNQTLTNVVVTDALLPAYSCTISVLPVGSAADTSCVATYTVTQADFDAGTITNNAKAVANKPDGTSIENDVSINVPAADPVPGLSIVKTSNIATGATFGPAGSTILYSFAVENTGNVTLENIEVTDPIDGTYLCTIASLAPQRTNTTCSLTYEVMQTDIDNGLITNTANVSGDVTRGDPLPPVINSNPLTLNGPDRTPGISVTKTAANAAFTAANETVNFSIAIENTGDVTADPPATITDTLTRNDGTVLALDAPGIPQYDSGDTNNNSKIDVDETWIYTAAYTTIQSDIDEGGINNAVSVTVNTPAGPVTDSGDVDVDAPQADPSISIVKTPSVDPFGAVGTPLDFNFTVRNTGNVTLTDVTVVDTGFGLNCVIGTLIPQQEDTATCEVNYSVTQDDINRGSITNTASVNGKAPDNSDVDATTTIVTNGPAQTRALTLVKSTTTGGYDAVGDTIDYSFLVTNTGNVTLTMPVSIDDDKLASPGPQAVCPQLPAGGLSPTAPDNTLTCTGTYVVTQDDLDAGSVVNIAKAISGATESPTDSLTVNATQTPDLGIVKRLASTSPTAFDTVGQTLEYDYVVTNTGNVSVTTDITIADDKINNATPPGVVTCPAIATLPDAKLLPGASITCTGSYAVTQEDIDNDGVTNTATPSTNGVNYPATSLTVPSVKMPELTLVKDTTAPIAAIATNQVVTYSYEITNTGNATFNGAIAVTDNLIDPADITCPALPAGGLSPQAPNNTITCTGTYTVTNDDVLLGTITNLASVAIGTSPPSATVSKTIPQGEPPALSIVKSVKNIQEPVGDDTLLPPTTDIVKIDQRIIYEYTVTNTGGATFGGDVTVIDNKIAAPIVCYPDQTVDFLPMQTATCEAVYTVIQDDLDAEEITNEAYASSPFGGRDILSPPDTVTIIPVVTDPATALTLEKKSDVPASGFTLGQTINYTIEATNSGNQTLRNVMISDPLLGLNCTVPQLDVGVTNTSCSGPYVIDQTVFDAGTLTNNASAVATTPDGQTVNAIDDLTIDGAATNRSFIIAKSSDITAPETFGNVGEPVEYAFAVTNNGDVTLTDIVITDPIDPTFSCTIASLAPGDPADTSCRLTYTVAQADIDNGSISNTAVGTAKSNRPGDVDLIDVPSTTVVINGPVQEPVLSVLKSSATTELTAVDQIVPYSYVVSNSGNVTLNGPFTVSDDKIPSLSCNFPVPVPPATEGALAPGEFFTCTGEYTVELPDMNAGSVTNTATATSPDAPDATDMLTIDVASAPSLSLVKTSAVNDGGDGVANKDDTVTYSYVVRNTGNVTLTGVQVLEAASGFTGAGTLPSPSGGAASLDPGEDTTFTATYVLLQEDIDNGSISNSATVNGNPPTGPPVSDVSDSGNASDPNETGTPGAPGESDPTGTSFGAQLALKAVKTVRTAPDPIVEGADIVFEVTVENTGNVTLTSADLTENLLRNDDVAVTTQPVPVFESATTGSSEAALIPDGVLTYTVTYTLEQADIDAGGVKNSVTASATPSGGGTPVSDISGDDPADPSSNDDPTVFDVTAAPALKTVKTVRTAPDPIVEGADIVFEVTVENTGNVTLTSADLTENLLRNDDVAVTTQPVPVFERATTGSSEAALIPNGVLTYEVTYTLEQADIDAGGVKNSVTASATPSGGGTPVSDISGDDPADPASNDDPTVFDIDITPTVELIKAVSFVDANGDGIAQVGETVTYTYTAENTSQTTLFDLVISEDSGSFTGTNGLPVPVFDRSSAGSPEGQLAPGETATYTASYVISSDDVVRGSLTNSAGASARSQNGTAASDVSDSADPDDGNNSDDPTVLVLAAPAPGELRVTKSATASVVQIGSSVNYTITVENIGSEPAIGVSVVDELPAGFVLTPGSVTLAGAAVMPDVSGRTVTINNLTLAPGEISSIGLTARISGAAGSGEFTNRAYAVDPATGNRISNIGEATVRIAPEPVFDCGDVIGKVFDDKNRNGYQDEGEPGLPGVRVVTTRGLLITTDAYGRYSVPCAALPNADIGSNFTLKLDTRTLPSGYRVTTENPRTVRLTRGKLTKLNFGASISRVVRLDLNAKAFVDGTSDPGDKLSRAVASIAKKLASEPSVLKLTYFAVSDADRALGAKRLRAFEKTVRSSWRRQRKSSGTLLVERNIVRAK